MFADGVSFSTNDAVKNNLCVETLVEAAGSVFLSLAWYAVSWHGSSCLTIVT